MSIVRRSEDLRRRCPVSYRDYELCLLPIYLVSRSQCYACILEVVDPAKMPYFHMISLSVYLRIRQPMIKSYYVQLDITDTNDNIVRP